MRGLQLVTPCCGRSVRAVPFMRHATEQYDRTCPTCGTPWRVLVRPIDEIEGGDAFAHQADWVKLPAAQAVQMESGPRPCIECCGKGTTVIRGCSHQGNCPCGADEAVPCPRCEGSKVEPCDHCGEPSAIRYLGADLCNPCAPAEDMRFDACSLCDRPIDVRESPLPLCPSCEATAKVAGQQAADARRHPDPEREHAA